MLPLQSLTTIYLLTKDLLGVLYINVCSTEIETLKPRQRKVLFFLS